MSQSVATNVLFEELLKNQEDIELFLAMHNDFPALYADLCVEFFRDCLVPKVQREIDKYNNEHSHKLELNLASGRERQILDKWGGLTVVSKTAWPENLYVFLESDKSYCHFFYAGVCLGDATGDMGSISMPLEQKIRGRFSALSGYYNSGIKCIHFEEPGRDWYSQKTFPLLAEEVLAGRNNTEVPHPTLVDRYVETVMTLIDITDKVTQENRSA